jgi:hypothetical protein
MTPSFEQIIESIEQLPAREQERLRQWLEDKRTANGADEVLQVENGRSEGSLRWLNENRQQYLGRWVALDGCRLIASGETAREVYSKAKADGVKTPFVELVTEGEPALFSGGWLS